MDDLWNAFRHGDWHLGNTLRLRQRPGVRRSRVGEATVLCLPQNNQEVSLNHSGRALWELCDGPQTIGEIFLKLSHGKNQPEHELVADMTKNFLQLHQCGALELLGMEEPRSGKTQSEKKEW